MSIEIYWKGLHVDFKITSLFFVPYQIGLVFLVRTKSTMNDRLWVVFYFFIYRKIQLATVEEPKKLHDSYFLFTKSIKNFFAKI